MAISEQQRGQYADEERPWIGRRFTIEEYLKLPDETLHLEFDDGVVTQKVAETAGRMGDGFIGTTPDADTVRTFAEAGGEGKPRYGQMTVCWAADEAEARKTALEWWPNAGIPGQLSQELALPSLFEQAAKLVTEDALAEMFPVGPDPERHLSTIREYADAGYDHVYVHQIGPDQDALFVRWDGGLREQLAAL